MGRKVSSFLSEAELDGDVLGHAVQRDDQPTSCTSKVARKAHFSGTLASVAAVTHSCTPASAHSRFIGSKYSCGNGSRSLRSREPSNRRSYSWDREP